MEFYLVQIGIIQKINYTQDIETSTEEPQPKSYEDGYNQAKKYAQLLNDINNKTEDIINKSKEFAEKDLKNIIVV